MMQFRWFVSMKRCTFKILLNIFYFTLHKKKHTNHFFYLLFLHVILFIMNHRHRQLCYHVFGKFSFTKCICLNIIYWWQSYVVLKMQRYFVILGWYWLKAKQLIKKSYSLCGIKRKVQKSMYIYFLIQHSVFFSFA